MSTSIAIMQPYAFPYIGYFQLISATDKFVILDDVNFIRRGWINRNRILVNNSDYLFTIPLKKSSQNKLIKDLIIFKPTEWKENFLKTISQSYSNAPQFKNVFKLISEILEPTEENLSKFIHNSLIVLCNYLNIGTKIIESSTVYENSDLKKEMKIIDICRKENADHYINPVGGIELYSKEEFGTHGIKLNFIKPRKIRYEQFGEKFVEDLSIIDVLMFNAKAKAKKFLKEYVLL